MENIVNWLWIMKQKSKKKKKKKNHFAPDGIRTRNRPNQRQVIYPVHYKYRLVTTVRTFHINYSKITVCSYKTLRFKNSFVIDKYLYKQTLSIKPP